MRQDVAHGCAKVLAAYLALVLVDADPPHTWHGVVGRAIQVGAPLACNLGQSGSSQFRVVDNPDRFKPGDDQSTAVLARTVGRLMVGAGHLRTVVGGELRCADLGMCG